MASARKTVAVESLPSASPAPWTTRSETYWLPFWLSSPLPVDIYDPLEAKLPLCSTNNFAGGLGMIQIVRYSDTPVGPYDELLIIPGNFTVPGGGQTTKGRMRISRIYVSQQETCYHGRNNWNIPKHLARFEFSSPPVKKGQPPPAELTVSVFPLGSNDDMQLPFFKTTITPSRYLSSFPMSTRWMPMNTELVQPPIPRGVDPWLCGTDLWRTFKVLCTSNKARLAWVTLRNGKDEVTQESFWPKVTPWSFGLWLEDAVMEIPLPSESKA